MAYPSNAASSPRNDSLLRTTPALQHLAHVTTRCYGLATWSTPPRLTQRTVKTEILIYRPQRSYNAAFSPRNDSLLRTALALQQLAHVMTRCYGLATTTRPYQRNVKTGTSIYQRPDRPQLPAVTIQLHPTTRPISAYPHQTPSCISTTRSMPATLVECPAGHNYNSTIPANDVTHPSWRPPPRTFTYTFVIPAIKSSLLLYLLSRLLSSFIVSGWHYIRTLKNP